MSFLGSFKTFFEKVGAELKKLFGSTNWEKTAASVVTYVAPLVETIVQLSAGSAAEALVAGVVSTVQSDLATLSAVVSGATSESSATDLQTAANVLNSIKANLSSLLQAAEVKNAAKSSQIQAAATLVINEVEAILANIPAAPAAA